MVGSYSGLSTVLFGSNEMMTDLVRISAVSASAVLNSAPGLKVACERSRTSLYSSDSLARMAAAFTLAGDTGASIAPSDL